MTSSLPLIACSLDSDGQRARLADWAHLLAQAATREETARGVRYSFASLAADFESRVRALAAADQDCCSFLQFKIVRADDQIEMTVTAPPEGREVWASFKPSGTPEGTTNPALRTFSRVSRARR